MVQRGKKYEAASEKVDPSMRYPLEEGVSLIKEMSYGRFDESIDGAFRLNVNPRHADQMVRGAVTLPNGTGKETRVLVFAQGDHAKEAEKAGADFVGADELFEKIEDGWTEFDVTVATPDLMGDVGRLGRILGPRGLMPSPKAGTVTFDIAEIVEKLKAGRLEYRVDKAGIVHMPVGRASFEVEELAENVQTIIERLARQKPASAKLPYFKSIALSATMSPSVKLDTSIGRDLLT